VRTRTTTIRRQLPYAVAALVASAVLAAVTATSAGAFAPPAWGSAISADQGGTPTAVTCASPALCVGVDQQGNAFSSATPTSSGSWTHVATGAANLNAISCPQGSFCVAVGQNGAAVTAASPTMTPWTALSSGDGTHNLTGVSCPSAQLCVASDDRGDVVFSTTPTTGGWTANSIGDGTTRLNAISCPTATFCAAVDASGKVLVSTTPTSGSAWTQTTLASGTALATISCTAAGTCVAADANGTVWATASAATPPVTWSQTPVDPGNAPLTVSCSNASLCVLVDDAGGEAATDTPAAGRPGWASTTIDPGHNLTAVSCADGGLCIAVDSQGSAFAATVPAPTAVTGTGSATSQTTATLTATVDPGDATLSDCHFVFGTSTAYGATAPCASTPAPGGGAQAVSAQITGLTAGTAYHFAIVASSGVGTGTGGDATFTTTAALKANPSLSGTPAVGSTLTCHSNVTTTASETVAYQWLSDTLPIAGATAATYVVAASNETHHLSCQVTIGGDGGTTSAVSGFDSIPAQSGGKVVESFVGTAKMSSTTVRAPVTCSVEAAGHCTFKLTLTTPETVNHKRKNVAVGTRSATVSTGSTVTLTVTLTAAGKRLLAAQHRLAITFSVSGTVLGTLTATLQTAHFTMTTPTPRKHATHHSG